MPGAKITAKKRSFKEVAVNLTECLEKEAEHTHEDDKEEDEEVAKILLSVRNGRNDNKPTVSMIQQGGKPAVPPSNLGMRDVYSKDTFDSSKASVKNLSASDFEARLGSLRADMRTRTGEYCSSKEHPRRATKCKCLHEFLALGDRKSGTYDGVSYRFQLLAFLKLFQEVTTAATVHWQRSWKAQKTREAKVPAISKNASQKESRPVSIDDYTEKHIVELLAYYTNFHFGDCSVAKNNNKPRIAYSFGSYMGKGNPPVRFCGNTFFKILGIYSGKSKSAQLTLLNKVPAYREKLVNNCARRVFIDLTLDGALAAIYADFSRSIIPEWELESKIGHMVRTVMERCNYGFKKELADAANNIARFYCSLLTSSTPVKAIVLTTQKPPKGALFDIYVGNTSTGIPIRASPGTVRRGSSFSFRNVTLTHSMNGYVADMRRFGSFFEAICLMKLRRPDITGMSVNSDSWLRYVASHGAVDGPVQLVYKIARGKEHCERTFGPDGITRSTNAMISSTPDLKKTLQLANEFYTSGIMSVLEHVAKLDGMVGEGEGLADKFDVRVDMGILWTKLTFKDAIAKVMKERKENVASDKKDELLPLMEKVTMGHQIRDRLFQAMHMDIKAETLFAHQNSVDEVTGLPDGDIFCVMFLAVVKEGMTLECQHSKGERFLIELPFGHMLLVPASFLHAGGFCSSLTGGLRLHMYADMLRKSTGQHKRKQLGTVSRVGSTAEGNDYIDADVPNRKHKDMTVYCKDDEEYRGEAVEVFDTLFNL